MTDMKTSAAVVCTEYLSGPLLGGWLQREVIYVIYVSSIHTICPPKAAPHATHPLSIHKIPDNATRPLIHFSLWRNPSEIETRSLVSFLTLSRHSHYSPICFPHFGQSFVDRLASLLSPHYIPTTLFSCFASHPRSHHTFPHQYHTPLKSRDELFQKLVVEVEDLSVHPRTTHLSCIMPTPLPSSFASAAAGNAHDPNRRGDGSAGGEWYAILPRLPDTHQLAPRHSNVQSCWSIIVFLNSSSA